MSIYKGTTLIAGAATNTVSNAHTLLDWKWTDHIISSMEWLRADTFSWQDGSVYTAAYNHLVSDYNGGDRLYGWGDSSYWVGTTSTAPSVGDSVYAGIPSAIVGTVESVGSGSITVGGTTYSRYSDVDGGFFDSVGSYWIRYVKAQDGHKITTYESTVANIYSESGVAWYYILDTVNTRFKLPRENSAREELIQIIRAKGNGITLGLTDGTTNYGAGTHSNDINGWTSLYGTGVGTAWSGTALPGSKSTGITTDSTKSGIISDMTESTSVYKGKKYLYFYVGQYNQSATEQTAGLNASLFNGKVDLDGSNAGFVHIVSTYHNGSEYYRVYSDGWCEQGGYKARAAATTGVTYLKEFTDTNYNLQMSVRHTAAGTDGRPPLIYNPTTTGFTASINTSYEGFYWKACGYIVIS